MNHYEAKQEARRERLERAADRADAQAAASFRRGDLREEVSGIPLGQPILVGHHSERRHRKAIERANNAMRAGIEASKRADELRAKAASVGEGGVSSDDPEAIEKLRAQLDTLERRQAFMKQANAAIRKHAAAGRDAQIAALNALVIAPESAAKLLEPNCFGQVGFPDFTLKNNNANIRRVRQRIADLERRAQVTPSADEVRGDVIVRRNADENRLQLIFDGKPSPEIRAALKARGFRWSPTNSAWQRQLNNSAEFAAQCVLREIASIQP